MNPFFNLSSPLFITAKKNSYGVDSRVVVIILYSPHPIVSVAPSWSPAKFYKYVFVFVYNINSAKYM